MQTLSLKFKMILLGILPALILAAGLTGFTVLQANQQGQQQIEDTRKNMPPVIFPVFAPSVMATI